ncbi:Vacuolar protease A [Rhizophlyctis rosea]|uniref:Vacuolar protease A n=1 Tax=Rhizophlyctis rosea TaxID=64517 RepID=A0AAD5S933_9FUNG|nr:Vacuolar protease A [Rhizophlyctis rosea]
MSNHAVAEEVLATKVVKVPTHSNTNLQAISSFSFINSLQTKIMKMVLPELDEHNAERLHKRVQGHLAKRQTTGGTLPKSSLEGWKLPGYFVDITLGTPKQTFQLMLDTGSFLPYVTNVGCRPCQSQDKFNSRLSSTYRNTSIPVSINYVKGSSNGTLGVDTFSIANQTITQQAFILSQQEDGGVPGYDGVLGIPPTPGGYYSLSNGSRPSTIPDDIISALVKQKQISQPVFGVFLDKPNFGVTTPNNGEITLGGWDESRIKGQVQWLQMRGAPGSGSGLARYVEMTEVRLEYMGQVRNGSIKVQDMAVFDTGGFSFAVFVIVGVEGMWNRELMEPHK